MSPAPDLDRPPTWASMRWQPLVPIALSLLMLVAAFIAGVQSGVSNSVSSLPVDRIGLVAVISSQAHGLAGEPYAGYRSVETILMNSGFNWSPGKSHDAFRSPQTMNAALQAASTADTCSSKLIFQAGNDQGTVDFTRGAFALFGINVTSHYYFFYLLYLISIMLFACCYWRDYGAGVLLFGCVCALYTFMPSYLITDGELLTVSSYRFLPTLGIIPLLHIMLLLWRNDPAIGWIALATTIAQATLISLAYAVRSTSLWMPIAVVILFGLLSIQPAFRILRERTPFDLGQLFGSRLPLLLAAAATMICIGTVRTFYMVPTCGIAANTHPLWETVFYGLVSHPDWQRRFAAKYNNASADDLIWTAAKLYAEQHHLPYQTEPSIFVTPPPGSVTSFEPVPFGSWQVLDKVMRAAFFEFAREHPRYVAECFFYYKPRELFITLFDFLRIVWRDTSTKQAILFLGTVALLVGVGLGSGRRRRHDVSTPGLLVITGVAFLSSLVPLLVAYSSNYLIVDQAYMLVSGLLTVVLLLVRSGVNVLVGRRGSASSA